MFDGNGGVKRKGTRDWRYMYDKDFLYVTLLYDGITFMKIQ